MWGHSWDYLQFFDDFIGITVRRNCTWLCRKSFGARNGIIEVCNCQAKEKGLDYQPLGLHDNCFFFLTFQSPTLLSEFLFNLLFVTEKQKSIKNLIKNVEIFLDSLAYDFSTRSFGWSCKDKQEHYIVQ